MLRAVEHPCYRQFRFNIVVFVTAGVPLCGEFFLLFLPVGYGKFSSSVHHGFKVLLGGENE